ncbi:hypothetical protein ACFQUU_21365 [Herbaspirillum sp. GCM10030257]|uniref:TOTE conflict system archaeo-eukaryotic primase domain-containing protein n=1 Tax=Herbaspirillum sp. GCM10030257 TaxID=3273393 RepID=UPI003608059B
MEKLIAELTRLYLPPGAVQSDVLERHLSGKANVTVSLTTDEGLVKAIVIPYDKMGPGEDAQHWSCLCKVAEGLQADLGLPMPAVSTSSTNGYRLWLSFGEPVPAAQAQRFLEALHLTYCPDMRLASNTVGAPVELPPCLDPRTGKWAAFIHPGMGASFADESGLEMEPPLAGQVAFLEGLESISLEQFQQALDILQHAHNATTAVTPANMPTASAAVARRAEPAEGLLLKDATLEDIVKFLHSKNIEPTFRHLIPR